MPRGFTGRPPGPMRAGRGPTELAPTKLAAWFATGQSLQSITSLVDDFDDGAIDPLKWSTTQFQGTITESGGGVNLLPTDQFAANLALTSALRFNLLGSAAYVRFVQPQQGAFTTSSAFCLFQLLGQGTFDAVYWTWNSGGNLSYVAAGPSGNVGSGTFGYSSTTHAWLRIKEAGGTVSFETAPASASNPPIESDWVIQGTVLASALGWSVGSVSVNFNAQIAGDVGVVATGPAIFDGFNTSATATATNYTLTASAGSYALSGQSATLLRSKLVIGSAGAYALSGQAVTVLRSKSLGASAGAYALTGQSANLLKSKLVTASSGSYLLTGRSATLLRTKLLSASAGAYSLTGQATTLLRARLIAASPGSYVVSGRSAVITYVPTGTPANYTLSALAGSYNVAGQSASLLRSRQIAASPGSYGASGQPVTLLRTRLVVASAGSYAVAGQSATVQKTQPSAPSAHEEDFGAMGAIATRRRVSRGLAPVIKPVADDDEDALLLLGML
jgi:hypothetical protein